MSEKEDTNYLNFITGGQVGDLIHELFIVKSICVEKKAKANLFIVNYENEFCNCGNFTFDLQKTYIDTSEIIEHQNYINKYEIYKDDFSKTKKDCNCGFRSKCVETEYINLQLWKKVYEQEKKSWTDLLSDFYRVPKLQNYKYLDARKTDDKTIDKVLIHNSDKRHNDNFPWEKLLKNIDSEILFICTDPREYEKFRFKNENIKIYLVPDISSLVDAISSCKLFIGNQSSPLAIASALDKPRIAELHHSSFLFYTNEQKYSKNISWFLNTNFKFNSENIPIKI